MKFCTTPLIKRIADFRDSW